MEKNYFVTKAQIVSGLEDKTRNVYNAKIISVYESSLMLEIENSDALIVVNRDNISYVRLQMSLETLFSAGEEYPVAVTGYKYTDDGNTYLYGHLHATFGNLDDIRKRINETAVFPVIKSNVKGNNAIAVSPNGISILPQNIGLDYYSAVEARITHITTRGKIRTEIVGCIEENQISNTDAFKQLFVKYRKSIDELPSFIDIQEFRESITVKPAVTPPAATRAIKPSTPIHMFDPQNI